jgi:hypothetical protein
MVWIITWLSPQINILIEVPAIYNPNIFVNDKGQIKAVRLDRKPFLRPIWIVDMEMSPPVSYEKGNFLNGLEVINF